MSSHKVCRFAAAMMAFGSAFIPGHVWASCENEDPGFQAQSINMAVGRVIVPANSQVGDRLAVEQFPMRTNPPDGSYPVKCDGSGGNAIGVMLQGQPSGVGQDIYTTNVQGIGVRLSRQIDDYGEDGAFVRYPHNLYLTPNTNYRVSQGYFRVEIFKTAPQTGSGPLAPGQYTNYYTQSDGPSKPLLTSYLDANAITIVSPTCEINAGSRNIPVDFGQVPKSRFEGVGTTNTERTFDIGMQCNGPNYGEAFLDLRFEYTPHPEGPAGTIALEETNDAASGVGIQLLDRRDNSTIENMEAVEVGTLVPGDNGRILSLPLKARYYQTQANVEPGRTKATAEFVIEYR
ncbi:fimbrial protein [Halomonas halmophila]|uniref:Outer membrane usher protein n=1 Tax=Halomonas halmophila TaxID=252 RepID=A0A4Y4F4I1_9GAMM|nr:fimbrial protein [Halomonas halmophila]GED23655.1 outer membrane usher protein [Halomonas halmophila]